MFREITYIACILGVSTFGTELIFRFKPENKTTDVVYNTQSDMVLAATAIEIIVSVGTLKVIDALTAIRMKVTAFCLLALLCSAIVLRAKYEFFGPLTDTKYNLYNSTSFFLVITTFLWIPFLLFKKATPLQDILPRSSTAPFSETLRRRQQEERRAQQRHYSGAVNRSSDIELDESLPSYYELPIPPAYTKVNGPPPPLEQEEMDLGSRASHQEQRDRPESSASTHNNNLAATEAALTAEGQSSPSTSQNNNNTDSLFSARSTWPRE